MKTQLFEKVITKCLKSPLTQQAYFDNVTYFSDRIFDLIPGIGANDAVKTTYIGGINISDIEYLFEPELNTFYQALKKIDFRAINSEDKLNDFYERLGYEKIFSEAVRAYLNLAAAITPYLLDGSKVRKYIINAIGKDKFEAIETKKGSENVATTLVTSLAFRLFSEITLKFNKKELNSSNFKENEKSYSETAYNIFTTKFRTNVDSFLTFENIQNTAFERIEQQIINPITNRIDKYLEELRHIFFNKGKKLGGIFSNELAFDKTVIDETINKLNSFDITKEAPLIKIANQFLAAQDLKKIITNNEINPEQRFKDFTDNFKDKKNIILNCDNSTQRSSSKFITTMLDIISLGIYKLARIINSRHERNLVKSTENVINEALEISPQFKMGMKK